MPEQDPDNKGLVAVSPANRAIPKSYMYISYMTVLFYSWESITKDWAEQNSYVSPLQNTHMYV